MLSHTSYSQYPIVKKIKGDSVVLITVKQASNINDTFTVYRDSIKLVKEELVKKKLLLDSLNAEVLPLVKRHEEYKWKYELNKNMYLEMEKEYKREKKLDATTKYLLVGLLVFIVSQLPR